MIIGDGFKGITHARAARALTVDPTATITNPGSLPTPTTAASPATAAATSTPSTATVGSTELKSDSYFSPRPLKVAHAPGSYSLRSFDSLYQLHQVIESSLQLSLTLPKIGISGEALVNDDRRIDTRNIYVLLQIRGVNYCEELMVPPQLNADALKVLGLQSPDILAVQAMVEQATRTSDRETTALKVVQQGRDNAKTNLDKATTALATVEVEMGILETILNTNPANDQAKKDVEAGKLKKTRATIEKDNADKILKEYDEVKLPTAVTKAEQAIAALKQANKDLMTAREHVAGQISEKQLQEFYEQFGDEYVYRCHYGRQFTALITLDRQEASVTSTYEGSVNLTSGELLKAGGKLKRVLEQIANRSIVRIDIACDGITPSALPTIDNMQSLQLAIEKFLAKDNSLAPVLIDFETWSYADVFQAAGIPITTRQLWDEATTKAKQLVVRSRELQAEAVKHYATRYPHRVRQNWPGDPLGASQANAANQANPHTVFLEKLFARLRAIITTLNKKIDIKASDIFPATSFLFHEKQDFQQLLNAIQLFIGVAQTRANQWDTDATTALSEAEAASNIKIIAEQTSNEVQPANLVEAWQQMNTKLWAVANQQITLAQAHSDSIKRFAALAKQTIADDQNNAVAVYTQITQIIHQVETLTLEQLRLAEKQSQQANLQSDIMREKLQLFKSQRNNRERSVDTTTLESHATAATQRSSAAQQRTDETQETSNEIAQWARHASKLPIRVASQGAKTSGQQFTDWTTLLTAVDRELQNIAPQLANRAQYTLLLTARAYNNFWFKRDKFPVTLPAGTAGLMISLTPSEKTARQALKKIFSEFKIVAEEFITFIQTRSRVTNVDQPQPSESQSTLITRANSNTEKLEALARNDKSDLDELLINTNAVLVDSESLLKLLDDSQKTDTDAKTRKAQKDFRLVFQQLKTVYQQLKLSDARASADLLLPSDEAEEFTGSEPAIVDPDPDYSLAWDKEKTWLFYDRVSLKCVKPYKDGSLVTAHKHHQAQPLLSCNSSTKQVDAYWKTPVYKPVLRNGCYDLRLFAMPPENKTLTDQSAPARSGPLTARRAVQQQLATVADAQTPFRKLKK